MGLIKNFDSLAETPERKIVLELIQTALEAIEPKLVLKKGFFLKDSVLHIHTEQFDLKKFKRVFVIGFGKGSSGITKIIEQILGNYLTLGYDIDNVKESFSKIQFTLGTHPLPSAQNLKFTQTVLENIHDLTKDDLVLVVICGGGSAMFELPFAIDLKTLDEIESKLLKSGATISEINVVRKHLSTVKGGKLAKHLYPATIASLIFSDVPGSNLSVIASGPTVKDTSTLDEYKNIVKKYNLTIPEKDFSELPQEEKYFENVYNILIVSNKTALNAIAQKAKEFGIKTQLFSDRAQGDAKLMGEKLLAATKTGTMLLVGGETTVKVKGTGKGGRNQTLVLASLPFLKENEIIASFDTDGDDFYYFTGAIGDLNTVKKAKKLHLNPKDFLDNDDSYAFLKKVGDGIYTGKLESNVSDIMIVWKK